MRRAGSDARMNGCELPVVINSGSGNQGITCCVPVVVYAKELDCTQKQLYRALVLSNLTTIYIKTGIGTLSAFCGAVSSGALRVLVLPIYIMEPIKKFKIRLSTH